MATFCMNMSWDRKLKKLAYLLEHWLDLAQIWCRGYFWILNPKSTKYFYTMSFLRQNDVKVKYHKSPVENAYDVIMVSPFVQFFENINISSSYKGLSSHQIWFN